MIQLDTKTHDANGAARYPLVLRSQFAIDSYPYQTLVAALDCTHTIRDGEGACRTELGCLDGWKPLGCGCSSCGRSNPATPHLVNPFTMGSVYDVPALHDPLKVEACQKIACYNDGNGRECWSVRDAGGKGVLFEFPDWETAARAALGGIRIAHTHQFSFC